MPSFTEQLRNADEQQELHRKTNAQSAPGPGEVSTGSVARPATSFLPFNRDEETEAMGELLSARINLGRAKPTAARVIEMACGHGDDRQLAERGLVRSGMKLGFFCDSPGVPSELAARRCLAISPEIAAERLLSRSQNRHSIVRILGSMPWAIYARRRIGWQRTRVVLIDVVSLRHEFSSLFGVNSARN